MTEYLVSADGTKIAYDVAGSGDPVILVHGASGDRHKYPALQKALLADHTLVTYDRRGRGQSEDGPVYDLLKEADDLRALIGAVTKSTGVEPIVFGISMGGRIALELLRDPPKVKSIIAFEAPIAASAEDVYLERIAHVRKTLDAEGAAAATVAHTKLLNRRTEEEIEALKINAAAWNARVASIPVTLRELEAIHCDLMFNPKHYPKPEFSVHTLFGTATLPFLKDSGRLWDSLDYIRRHTLEGMDHSAPDKVPDVVFKAFCSAKEQ